MGRIQGDLKERTFRFGLSILKVANQLPNNVRGWVLGKQLICAGTSIGANIRDADNGQSDADFAHKCSLARNEASETHYWLDLCVQAGLLDGDETRRLLREADELVRIRSVIVRGTQKHIAHSR